MKEIQQLRCIALKLGVSGTALPITETRLYKGSYGFVKLQVYAPKTQNTEAPVCTAFCTTTDELGKEKISTRNYNLMYVGEFDLEGKAYLLFESLLPKEFTQKETSPNGLKITFNYFDTEVTTDERGEIVLDESGVPKRHATDLLVSSTYVTTVYPGGWNNEDVELNINKAEVGQIVANMNDIAEIQTQMDYIKAIADGTHADSSEALETANEAKQTADGLADSIAKANATAKEAVETANTAVNDIEQYKDETNGDIMQFMQTVEDDISQFKSTINDNVTSLEEDINSTIDDVNNFKSNVAQVISNFETGVNTKLDKFEEQLADTGTIVKVDGVSQKELSFDSDPQGQFNALNANDEELQSQITELGIVDESLQEQANALVDGKVSKSGDTMSGSLQINFERQEGGAFVVTKGAEGISFGIDGYGDKGIYDLKQDKYRLKFNDEDITSYDTDFLLIHEQTDKHAMFTAERADTGNSIGFGVGSGGTNRGIWDNNLDKWIFHTDGNKVYVNGAVPLPISGGTMTGTINLAYTALSTYENSGWTMDSYGNLKHKRDTATDNWNLQSSNGTSKFQIFFETGAVNAQGAVTAPKFSQSDTSKDYVDFGTSGIGFGIGGENATIYRLQQMLRVDPTKLEPTTANGWTVGTSTLGLPTAGIYLLSATIASKQCCGIMIATGNIAIQGSCVCTTDNYVNQQSNPIAYAITYTWGWTALNIATNAKATITAIAYKKLA